MKIRRRSDRERADGVPPVHTLITCTYQKLFKRDGGVLDNGAPRKPHRHELGGSWASILPETNEEGDDLGGVKHGDGDGNDSRHDLHDERTNPLLPKRRKVKSTRYADFAEEATPHSVKTERRARHMDKDAEENMSTVVSSKEALIASIFYVYDTLGKTGLTASEVVATMLEQRLPGLKEGGARHTVQVANVLRRSRHFLSIGNKQYLPCKVADDPGKKPKQGSASRSKHPHSESCKLYDGSGWHCSRDAYPEFSLCSHHLEMINRPLGQVQAPESPRIQAPESDSDREDIGPALAKWGRDRTPGSAPNQKRKMLSLMSIK